MPIKAVVFDFDLTLADSTLAVVECSNHALVAMGFEAADAQRVRRTIGLTLPQAFRALAGRSDPNLEAEYSRRFVNRADEVMVAWTQVYPEVPRALETLRSRGIRTAIVSTKYRYRIEQILAKAGLSDAVDIIVGGEDVQRHKPDPEGLLVAIVRLEVDRSQALYVGDHPVDAEAAQAAGTHFIAVRTGVSPPETWSQWPRITVVDNVGGLLELVLST